MLGASIPEEPTMHRRIIFTSTMLSLCVALTACFDKGDNADEAGSGTDDTTGADTSTDSAGTDTTAGDTTTASDTASDTADTTTGDTTDTTTGMAGFCDSDPGWGPLAVGEPVKHIQGFDQTGAEFNMCNYGGTPIIIDVAAVWCGPCNMVSDYFAHGGSDPFGGGLGDQLTNMIATDKVIWMTTLVEDANSAPATVTNATAWDAMYPNPKIPVVVEGDIQMLPSYFQLQCWPSAFIVDPEMKWRGFDDCTTWNQLVDVVNTYGG